MSGAQQTIADVYATHDATALAELVRRREVSPRELVDAAIERIEQVDGELNAVVGRRFEEARGEAEGELPDGPLRGVPVLLKDLGAELAGQTNYGGSAALRDLALRTDHDSHVGRSFVDAGLVVLGRTNTPEGGLTFTTEPTAFGPTRNPWDPTRSPAGSSGGSAAAVAAGYVPVAHANDGGGSIRVPAAACGIVGLKPTRARVSYAPDGWEGFAGLATEGCVSRSVRDTALLLDRLAGYQPGDVLMARPPERPYAQEVGADPGRLRIGVKTELAGFATDPECAAGAQAAARLLAELGHDVDEQGPAALDRYAELSGAFLDILSASTAAQVGLLKMALGGEELPEGSIEPLTRWHAERGEQIGAPEHVRTRALLHLWTRELTAWWERDGWDLLVTPTMAVEPFQLGAIAFDPADVEDSHRRMLAVAPWTPSFNISGQPAISLPLHWSASGLPIGVQLVAAPGREDLLIRVAAQLEQARPWADKRPPL